MISRRKLLAGAGALAASALFTRRSVRAACPPTAAWAGAALDVSAWGGPSKILEIFLYGGLSAWESFYVPPLLGTAPPSRRLFSAAQLASFDSTQIAAACGGEPATHTRVFNPAVPAQRMEWSVGTAPLWERDDILRRTRVITMTHEMGAHPIAIPLALTGRRFGDSRAASIGAAVKRMYPGQHTSYVLMPEISRFFPGDRSAFDAWLTVGAHGAASRPVVVPMSSEASDLAAWAQRTEVPAGADALSGFYADLYEENLGAGRSRGYYAYRSSLCSLPGSGALSPVFASPLRTDGVPGVHCSTGAYAPGTPQRTTTAAQLAMAGWLFNTQGSRYVGMVDVGLGLDTMAAYDGHNNTAGVTFGNLHSLLSALIAATGPATPADRRIDLDDTLVVLNTEFGRTPRADGPAGRDHFPRGYTVVLIGGPIQPTASGHPKLIGSFDLMATEPVGTYGPEHVASTVLAAAGINPHHPDNFAVAELGPYAAIFDA